MQSPTSAAAFPLRAERPRSSAGGSLGADLRLFGMTFAAGFLFISLFIA